MEREARNNLVNEWQLVDKVWLSILSIFFDIFCLFLIQKDNHFVAINNTKRELSNFKADRNEITADLEKGRTARASLFKVFLVFAS